MNENYIKNIYDKKEKEKILYEYFKEKPNLKAKKIKPQIVSGIQVYLEYDESVDSDDETIIQNKKQSITNKR